MAAFTYASAVHTNTKAYPTAGGIHLSGPSDIVAADGTSDLPGSGQAHREAGQGGSFLLRCASR